MNLALKEVKELKGVQKRKKKVWKSWFKVFEKFFFRKWAWKKKLASTKNDELLAANLR